MGLVASQARLLFLTARMSDLQFYMQNISQKRMNLSAKMLKVQLQDTDTFWNQAGDFVNGILGINICGGTEKAEKEKEKQLLVLQEQDKQLEMLLKTYETQEKAISTEYESVQKIIDNNIKRSFKYMA